MTDAYDEEFFLLCDFLAERLDLTTHFIQINVACVGLRSVRRMLKDVSIYSSSDGIEWDSMKNLELDEDWLQLRLEAVWKMVMKISKKMRKE